jgi:cytochrome c-type biogenesis protein CcmH
MIIRHLILLLLITLTPTAFAEIEAYTFPSPEQETTYQELIHELRCVVCQNQNLADSNAKLAQDLRTQIHSQLVEKGLDKQMIIDYMVSRYGEFVLYKPRLAAHTFLLWIAPLVFLILGVWAMLSFWRNNSQLTH